MLPAFLDSSYTVAPPLTLGTVPLCCVHACAVHAHTQVLAQLTSKCAAGRCDGVPCFSVVTQLPSQCLPPLSCPLWCFHSLLVEAELLRYENTATNGEFAMGKGHSYYESWRPHFDGNERTPALSRMPGYWEVGEGQPCQSRG